MKFILGKKIGMTTIYTEKRAQNVTLVSTGVNKISELRTESRDRYNAVQISFDFGKKKNVVREFRVDNIEGFEKNKEITLEQFKEGEKVVVSGVSKGKRYQGVVKRHGFAGSPASHGHRHDLRAPGSIGSAFPERVMKGKRMAGRMGSQSVTVSNLEIVKIDKEKRLVAIKGAIPGNNGSVVKIISQD